MLHRVIVVYKHVVIVTREHCDSALPSSDTVVSEPVVTVVTETLLVRFVANFFLLFQHSCKLLFIFFCCFLNVFYWP